MKSKKFLLEILKVKLLFFVTFIGGVFGLFMKSVSFFNLMIFAILTLIGINGVKKN